MIRRLRRSKALGGQGRPAIPAAPAAVTPPTGFDVVPERPVWMTLGLFAVVVFVASAFAHLFRESAQHVIEWYSDVRNPTGAADALPVWVVFLTVAGAVACAAALGRLVERRWGRHVGVEAVAASARNEGRSISLRATAVRSIATWTVSSGMVSIGRESAIIETGGAVGAVAGRKFRGRGDAMATAGIAAAFAAAYHAPVAAVLYVEEHLGVRRSPRAIAFASAGALAGHLTSVWLLGGEKIFPGTQGSRTRMLAFALATLVPAVVMARIFLQLRVRASGGALASLLGVREWVGVAALSLVAGAMVAVFPLAAGNGMEALRRGSVGATLALAVALTIGKLIGTTAALGAGAPGGVLTPTISIASGSALLTLLAFDAIGIAVAHPWDVMVAAMSVGVAVGLRSPVMAVFLLPEMLGDYTLVPVIAIVVGAAVLLDRGLDRAVVALGARVPRGVYDEDA
jgi:CIC family chloride channel protein